MVLLGLGSILHLTTRIDPGEAPEKTEGPVVHNLCSGTGRGLEWQGRTPAARRAGEIRFREDLLAAEPVLRRGEILEFAFFDDPVRQARIREVRTWGRATVAVTADLLGSEHGRLFLSYTDGEAAMLIQDPVKSLLFKVEYLAAEGRYVVLEVDPAESDLLSCGADMLDPVATGKLLGGPAGEETAIEGGAVLHADSPSGTVTLDILAVYTGAARESEGGQAGMENNISLSLQLGNDVHANSDTRMTFNLVHSEEAIYAQHEPESADSPVTYLEDITFGNVPGIHELRETQEADFVVFYVSTEQTGGLAWTGRHYRMAEWTYSLVRAEQTDWTYTMVHEVGHNMGLGHSATQTVQPYDGHFLHDAAGWQWADPSSSASIGYCSVMTYENFDNAGGPEYRRVGHFSNPEVTYNGIPTGDLEEANAARVLRNGRFEYSGYRGSKAPFAEVISSFPYTIGFEDYTGLWHQPDGDTMDWDNGSGSTPSGGTGPEAAYAGRYYLFIKASDFGPGMEGVLEAGTDFRGYEGAGIQFHYHMSGSGMGMLVLEGSEDGGLTWGEIWSVGGDQGDAWQSQAVDLSPLDGTAVRLRFRAIRGAGYQSDIALDTVTLSATPVTAADYSGWVAADYPDLSDPDPTADPDFDGVENFLEYAFGMEPDRADVRNAPQVTREAGPGVLRIVFRRARESVRYEVHSTTDVRNWTAALTEWDSGAGPSNLVPVGGLQAVDVLIPEEGRIFLRVEATE